MKSVTYKRAQDIPTSITRELVRTGAEGELGLGLLSRLAVVPDQWGDNVLLMGVFEAGTPIGYVMQTGENPALVVGFTSPSEIAFPELAAAISAAGFVPTSMNGARRWSDPLAQAWCDLQGTTISKTLAMRAMELRAVASPAKPPRGELRAAFDKDMDVVCEWTQAFSLEALDENEPLEAAQKRARRLINDEDLALWDLDGTAVAMAAVSRRTDSSACISLVYTPPEFRGNSYARTLVAELSQRELDAGCEWTSLFTDAANPTSNWIYEQIGYVHKCDFAHHSFAQPVD